MRNVVFSLVFIMFLAIPVKAQNFVDEAYVDMRTGFAQTFSDGGWTGRFHVDYLNIHAKGHIADNLTYTFRHRLTKPAYADNNPLNATDFAWITWQATPKFSLTGGKHPVWFGSFEFDADPIDVFFWSKSIADLYQYYTLGVTGTYEVAPSQNLSFQFSQSPLSRGITNCFSYSLYWNGSFTPWWKTTWSLNFVDNEVRTMMNYLVLGNRFDIRNFIVELDLINKTAMHQRRPLFSDGAVILNAKYEMEKVNICLKATYDGNWSGNCVRDRFGNVIENWDVVVPAGYDVTQIAAGAEYFPLGNRNLRLHAFLSMISSMENACTLELGATWRFDLFKRK